MPSLSSFALALPIRSDCLPTPGSDYQAAHISWPPPCHVDHIARRTMLLYSFPRPAAIPFRVAGTARRGFPGPVSWPTTPTASAVPARGSGDRRLRTCARHRLYTVADDKREGHQRRRQPEAVEGNGQADEPQHHAEIDGVAREAVRARVHVSRNSAGSPHFGVVGK